MRVKFAVGVNGITTGTSLKTLLQIIAASNHRVTISEISIGFHGTSNTDAPILVQIARQTTAGTVTSATPVKRTPGDDEALQVTASHTATSEPTLGDVLKRWSVHPQTGLVWQAPPGQEIVIPGGGRLGILVTAGASTTADVYAEGEE